MWKNNGKLVLLDGYRFMIAKKYNLPFKIVEKNFDTLDEAKLWVISNQLGRRNLTDEQRAYVQGKFYKLMKKKPKGFDDRNIARGQNEHGVKNHLQRRN